MASLDDTRRFRNFFPIFLILMTINLPSHFYPMFDADRFIGWSSYFGSRWFSEMADRMQLNYGCAPSAMLANIQGYAFWYGILLLSICGGVIFFVGKSAKTALRLLVPAIAVSTSTSALLVYFDVIFAVFPPPFLCRTTSFETSEAAVMDEVSRHLCQQISMTILSPIIVVSLGVLLLKGFRRLMSRRQASPD